MGGHQGTVAFTVAYIIMSQLMLPRGCWGNLLNLLDCQEGQRNPIDLAQVVLVLDIWLVGVIHLIRAMGGLIPQWDWTRCYCLSYWLLFIYSTIIDIVVLVASNYKSSPP